MGRDMLENQITKVKTQDKLISNCKSGQVFSKNDRIIVGKKGWALRMGIFIGYFVLIFSYFNEGLATGNSLIFYSFIVPVSTFLTFFFGWLFYKNPVIKNFDDKELVSIVIPVYNQESMIEQVVDVVYESTYKNIEVVVVNDGSKDRTAEVLNKIENSKKYPSLKIIHKPNGGKRKAVAAGFYASKGNYLVFIDSDTIVDSKAVEELMKAFAKDPKVGGLVGNVKPINVRKNFLTKCQDCWYDFSFNILRTCESLFGTVTCLAGVLAAYRREAIENFIPYWETSPKNRFGTDREMTSFVYAPQSAKKNLQSVFGNKFWVPLSQKMMESVAKYDDAEDRGLTAQSLPSWKTVYVASALAYTEVPDNIRQFSKQQIRWKKGYLRANFFVSSFFWKKNPIMAFIFYMHFMATMTTPLVNVITFVYVPIFMGNWLWTLSIFLTTMIVGFAEGLDYKYRDPRAEYWWYKPFSILLLHNFTSWFIIAALIDFRRNAWRTR